MEEVAGTPEKARAEDTQEGATAGAGRNWESVDCLEQGWAPGGRPPGRQSRDFRETNAGESLPSPPSTS